MQSLTEILEETKWGDVCGIGTDKNTTHSYIDGFYEKYFLEYKTKPIKILEIGISSGHSLLLWDKYFANHEGVYGVDINHPYGLVLEESQKSQKIKLVVGNAYTDQVANYLPNFDIVIDDGPHNLPSMISCIELYLPKINSNGMLVIEDVQSEDWFSILIHTFEKNKSKDDKYEIIDLRSIKNRYDDLMFVIKKG